MKKMITRFLLTCALVIVILSMRQTGLLDVCYAATLDTELLTNGGGDSGGGWIAVADNNAYTWSSITGGRTNNYWGIWASGYFAQEETCYQVVDVSNLDFSGGNTIVSLTGYYIEEDPYSANYPNYITITLQQLDVNDNVLSSSNRSCSTYKVWQNFLISETMLSGTKKLKVILSGRVWGEGGGNLYIGFDDVSMKLGQPEDLAPVIQSIDDKIMDSGSTIGPIGFTATDPEGKPLTMTVTSSNTDLINASGIVASLTGNNGSISLTSVNGMTGSTEISINVSDGVRNTTEKFIVTVYPNIQIGSNMVRNYDGTSLDGWLDQESRITPGSCFTVSTVNSPGSTYYFYQYIDVTRFSTYIDTGLAGFTSGCTLSAGGVFELYAIDANGAEVQMPNSGILMVGTRRIKIKVGGPVNTTIDNVNVTIVNTTKMSTISDHTCVAGAELSNQSFKVIYPSTGITLSAVSNNQNVVKDSTITFGGSDYYRTISVPTVAGTHGSATISVKANGTTIGTFHVSTYTSPGAPTNISVSDTTGGILVAFTPPVSDGGSTILYYEVTSNPGSITVSGNTSPITVTGLSSGTSYTFTVKAINSVGAGAVSASSSSVIATSIPSVDSAVVNDITAYTATVSNRITSDGSSPIIARGLEYRKSVDSSYITIAAPTSGIGSFNIELTGLSLNTQYDVRTYATNAKGTAYGSVIQFTTLNNTNPTMSIMTSVQEMNEDEESAEINFTISDQETAPGGLTVSAFSDNALLVPNTPANLVLGGSDTNRTIKIVPSANQNGTVNITLTVTDPLGSSTSRTFSIKVNPVNDAPVAHSITVNAMEDTLMNGTLTGYDVDGDTLTYELVEQSLKGTTTVHSDGSFSYVPFINAVGMDSFKFKVKDKALTSTNATVTVMIEAVNDAPVANAGSLTVTEDLQQAGTLNITDIDGDSLVYEVVEHPSKGNVSIASDGNYIYIPNSNVTGSDYFTFRVKDAALYSNTATITITIEGVNDAPQATDGSLNVIEDVQQNGMLAGTDIEGDSLTYELVAQATKGTVIVDPNGSYTYTPNKDATGSDSFTFRAKDHALYSGTAAITITIAGVNDAPVANTGTIYVTEDSSKSGTLSGTDIDGDALTYELVTQPVKGSIIVNSDGSYIYTPFANLTGSDSFIFKVKDAFLYSDEATIAINISEVNDAPVANAGSFTVTEDMQKNGTLTGADIDGDTLTYELVTQASKGTVTVHPNGSYTYIPNLDMNGSDSFTFRAKDGGLYSVAETITITIEAVNDAPVANAGDLSVTEDTQKSGILSGTDIDGDDLSYELVTQAVKGIVTVSVDGTYTYVPNADATGNDSFTFRAKDAALTSGIATITITIEPVNDAPVANSGTLKVTKNLHKVGRVTGTDIDGDGLTFEVASLPTKGTLTVNADGSYDYIPNPDTIGSDSFTFKAKDAFLYSAEATITITIEEPVYIPTENGATNDSQEKKAANVIQIILEDKTQKNSNYIIPSEDILKDIANSDKEKVAVAIQIVQNNKNEDKQVQKASLILQSEVLESAKKNDKTIQVSAKNEDQKELYTWIFDKKELAASENKISDVNLLVEVGSLEQATKVGEIAEIINGTGIVLSFAYEGVLPCQAQIRIFVGDQEGATPGLPVYLYHYNYDTQKLESLPNSSGYIVDKDGYVTIQLVHCSDYVLLFEEGNGDKITGLADQIVVTPSKATLYTGGAVDATSHIQIVLPPTLTAKGSLEQEADTTAVGTILIAYASDNKKVAIVNKSGKITAVGAGKTMITTTLTLPDGTVKTIQTVITVKKPYLEMNNSVNAMKLGESFQFTAMAYGVDIKNATWSTSRKSIIVVNKKTGKAVAKSKGTDYITVKVGKTEYVLKVVVK